MRTEQQKLAAEQRARLITLFGVPRDQTLPDVYASGVMVLFDKSDAIIQERIILWAEANATQSQSSASISKFLNAMLRLNEEKDFLAQMSRAEAIKKNIDRFIASLPHLTSPRTLANHKVIIEDFLKVILGEKTIKTSFKTAQIAVEKKVTPAPPSDYLFGTSPFDYQRNMFVASGASPHFPEIELDATNAKTQGFIPSEDQAIALTTIVEMIEKKQIALKPVPSRGSKSLSAQLSYGIIRNLLEIGVYKTDNGRHYLEQAFIETMQKPELAKKFFKWRKDYLDYRTNRARAHFSQLSGANPT